MVKVLFGILIKCSEMKLCVQSKIFQTNCRYARSTANKAYMIKTTAMLIYRQQRNPRSFIYSTYLLRRNIQSVLLCTENCGLLNLITVNQMLEVSTGFFSLILSSPVIKQIKLPQTFLLMQQWKK